MGFLAPIALGVAGGLFAAGGRGGGSMPQPPSYQPMQENPPQLAEMPSPQEIMQFIDELSGVQFMPVRQPNGTMQLKLMRLPRTEQEETIFRQGEQLLRSSLENVQRLTQYNPNEAASFRPFIDTFANINNQRLEDLSRLGNFTSIGQDIQNFRSMQTQLLDQEFGLQGNRLQDEMAHRGLAGSTSNQELKAALASEHAQARQQVDMNAQLMGSDLRSRQLEQEANLYGLRDTGRQAQLQQAELAYQLPIEQQQTAMQNSLAQANVGAQMRNQEQARLMGSMAPQLSSQITDNQNMQMLDRWNSTVQGQQNRYQLALQQHNANTGQRMNVYGAQMDNFRSRPPSFGQFLGNSMLNISGRAMGNQLMRQGWM